MRKYKFTINGNNYNVTVKNVENNIAIVDLNGTEVEVNLNQDFTTSKTPIIARKEITNKQGDSATKFNPVQQEAKPSARSIKSPLPGNVIKVMFKEGDIFKEDDVLMVLESMKMENNILAERSGKILKVHIQPGQAVLQDVPLFDIE